MKKDIKMRIALGIMILIAFLFLSGIRSAIIISGSMEPEIQTGSLTFINTKAKYEEIKEGDIIAFELGRAMTIHRVLDITPEGIETKGDANEVSDGITTNAYNYKGKVIFSIPHIGYPIAKGKEILSMFMNFLVMKAEAQEAVHTEQQTLLTETTEGNLVRYTLVRDGGNSENIWLFTYIKDAKSTPTIWSGPTGSITQGVMSPNNFIRDGLEYNYSYKIPIVFGKYGLYCFNINVDGTLQGRVNYIAGNCKVESTFYNTVADAANEAASGSAIEVLRADCREYLPIKVKNKTLTIKPSETNIVTAEGYSIEVRDYEENVTIYQPNEFNNQYLIMNYCGNLTLSGAGKNTMNLNGNNLSYTVNGVSYTPIAVFCYTEGMYNAVTNIKSGVNVYGVSDNNSGMGIGNIPAQDAKGTSTLNIEDGVSSYNNRGYGVQSTGITNITGGSFYNNGDNGILIMSGSENTSCNITGGNYYQNGNGIALGNTMEFEENDHKAIITGTNIYENEKDGVYVNTNSGGAWSVTFEDNHIYGNEYGIYLNKGLDFMFKSGNVYANKNAGVSLNAGTFCMAGGKIYENENSGIYNKDIVKISDAAIITNNKAQYGGGIHNEGRLEITGGEIKKNEAQYGGGIHNIGEIHMKGGLITNNTATLYGGGISNWGKGYSDINEPIAIYSKTDHSLRFYNREIEYLEVGDIFEGREVTDIFTDIEKTDGTNRTVIWGSYYAEQIEKVIVEDKIQPVNTSSWFAYMNYCSYMDLVKLDMSRVTDSSWMFYYTASKAEKWITSGIENFDMSRVLDVSRMFYYTGYLADYHLNLSGWNVKNVAENTNFHRGVTDKIIPPDFVEINSMTTLAVTKAVQEAELLEAEKEILTAGYLSISGGCITENIAGFNGGGIYNNHKTIHLTGGVISGNKASDLLGYGDGIFHMGEELYMSKDAVVDLDNPIQLGVSKYGDETGCARIIVNGKINGTGVIARICPYSYYDKYGTVCVKAVFDETVASDIINHFELCEMSSYPKAILRPGDYLDESSNVEGTDVIVSTFYNVVYDANGGREHPDTQKKYWDESILLSEDLPVREGYSFVDWNTQRSGGGTAFKAKDSYSGNRDLDLYAQWDLKKRSVTVSCQIRASDYHPEHGDVSFLIKLEGVDLEGNKHTYYQPVILEYVAGEFIRKEVIFSDIPAGEYFIKSEDISRWSVEGIDDVQNAEIFSDHAIVNLNVYENAAVLFRYKKYEWQGFSDSDMIINSFHK